MRFGDWKAVRNGPSAPLELYDLKTDTAEQHDLASEKRDIAAEAIRLMNLSRADDPNWPMSEGRKKAGKIKKQ